MGINLRMLPDPLQHLIWIERVAQTVADVVDGDDAEIEFPILHFPAELPKTESL